MQVPHMTLEAAARLRALGGGGEAEGDGGGEEGGVETVYALAAMDAGLRQRVLGCSAAQLVDVAAFCNRYPSIDVTFELGVSLGASGRESAGKVFPPPGRPVPRCCRRPRPSLPAATCPSPSSSSETRRQRAWTRAQAWGLSTRHSSRGPRPRAGGSSSGSRRPTPSSRSSASPWRGAQR